MSYEPEYTVLDDNDTIHCHFECRQCRNKVIVTVKDQEYKAWKSGEYVQRAFFSHSADDREMFISGVCRVCWNKTIASEEMD